MRYLRFALLPLVFAACGEQTPVAPLDDRPAFNWMNNPNVGNFKVFRSEAGIAACWTDPRNGLRACHATVPLGLGNEPDCGLQDVVDGVAWQQLLIDEEAFRVVAHAVGEVWITIRDLNNAGTCFNSALVAEGWGTMHYTDNDQFGSLVSNVNTWGYSASGDITTTDGNAVDYTGHARFTYSIDDEGNEVFRALGNQVILK